MMNWYFLNLLGVALVNAACYEPNQAYPPPSYAPDDALLKRTFASIHAALEVVVAAPEFASTSFSVEVTSSKQSLWSQHHTAVERNASRPDIPTVNGDALYRIASVTKSFTVLALLYQHAAGNLSLDDSIDTYIEELRGKEAGSIPWKDITLRTLASQLSGIPREFAQSDLINSLPKPWEYGLPPVSRHGLLKCDEYSHGYDVPCDKANLLRSVKSKTPLFAPNQRSTYSNVAFELLGLAIENVTNQSYESYINDAIFKPLHMTKSTLSKPPDNAGVIPMDPQYWGVDEGIQNPTGGIYSSSTDLSKYLRYILTHYSDITSAASWAHPASPATGLQSFYGMPWEIFQTNRILINSSRTVRFITKGGGLPGYFSIIMYLPEYDLGFTILVAGNSALLKTIRELVTVEVVRAAEKIAIQQLQERYAGKYVSSMAHLNSSMTLIADHRGLVLAQLISNGSDISGPGGLARMFAPPDRPWYGVLVPTLLYRNENAQKGEKWRLILAEERTDGDQPIWEDFCVTDVDAANYGNLPVNEIVFWSGKGTAVETVELTGFRVTLSRQDEEEPSHLWTDESQEPLEL
ncbi:beta-lactamase/transpeptidase-like protein [Lindgomyces ingoldianus]|uniref:Beta-lactamase/transpeptidase-like protein n=1 Tax=Lindgomyces ingoldianus TaxID=673940 RepID=A0ACB6QH10_9PLEO|nr:beta-lactamase/transpeptidase-like protein [Lindgomyces ingoldianus]KAF2466209.1 beta-lactamase/transpeptidase-like protein [Lindgomyces ingoldianus]